MNFSSFKNTNPIYFYFISISSFVLANLVRSKSINFYYFLLLVGLVFFVLGMVKRMKNK
ncbi:hypothetical protein SAMN04488130_10698 [Flavobacterium urumqiense]|uniref:Uncharacterized protein n=1 Tax=Flavobacterium urumqiense TaxID=935224 RepID=A0A1H5XMU9_9FLAO|nr:hypothetical protein SAMN04488130_10698 [Flavobacterium urumqiense]